jgi:hypothetical protein
MIHYKIVVFIPNETLTKQTTTTEFIKENEEIFLKYKTTNAASLYVFALSVKK